VQRRWRPLQNEDDARSIMVARMGEDRELGDLETLARMAARLAGRDADERLTLKFGGTIVFDDVLWRYPDFLKRAEAAYEVLKRGTLPG